MSVEDRSEPNPPRALPDDEGRRLHRRGFFREGFRQLLKPLAEIIEERVEDAALTRWEEHSTGGEYGGTGSLAAERAAGRTLLRPPGALPEEEFLARCVGSGGCVEACPVAAIRLVAAVDPAAGAKPAIDPDAQACVLCEDLACMKACPTGALRVLEREEIDMGLAVVRPDVCVRSQGEDCQICVDKCPVGPMAIDIPEYGGDVEVDADGCTGCGVCQMYCPSEPRAIVVEPRRDR